MKNKLLVALALLAMVATVAKATSLEPSLYEGSLEDRSSLYEFVGGNWVPISTGAVPKDGDEQRTVFKMDALDFEGVIIDRDPPFTTGIEASTPVLTYNNSALSGLLYDVVISSVTPVGPTMSDIQFAPGGRYTNAGGTDGIWTDTNPGAGGLVATTLAGYGGIVVVYDDNPFLNLPLFQGDGGGQADWVEGTLGPMADGSLSAADYFPSISDVPGTVGPNDSGTASPAIIMVLAPLPAAVLANPLWNANPGDVLTEQNFDPTAGGFGLAFANIIGGSMASLFQTDLFGPGLDVRFDFEIDVRSSGGVPVLTNDGWQTESDDPIQFGVIPEPATLSLLGFGIAGLVLRRRRKK